ncbi:MAG: TolC family protein [Thermoanaerobaculia bacterium]|nr:TolC family protein [Thermoanaerobaculia bacterium]
MFHLKIPTVWWVLAVLLSGNTLYAQTLTLQQALDAAVQHHPAVKSATLQVRQQQQLLPAAAALADPLLTAESPTGNFYTLGVTQAFSMPAVYRRQKALQQAQISRSESAVAVTGQDIKLQTALVYNEWQYQWMLVRQLEVQDSLLQNLAEAAGRMFREGQTDAVAAQYARLQAATLHSRLRQARQGTIAAYAQLSALTGISADRQPEPPDPLSLRKIPVITADSLLMQANPAMQTLQQEILVAERALEVAKSRGLPELALGYINQGERNSPVGNRFNVGVTIPLWRKQYNAGAAAARTGVEIARETLAAQSLELNAAYRQALGEAEKARLALEEYEQNVLPAARAVSDASRRLFEGGLTDWVSYLRNRNDALEVELGYWELIRDVQLAELDLKFLTGKL